MNLTCTYFWKKKLWPKLVSIVRGTICKKFRQTNTSKSKFLAYHWCCLATTLGHYSLLCHNNVIMYECESYFVQLVRRTQWSLGSRSVRVTSRVRTSPCRRCLTSHYRAWYEPPEPSSGSTRSSSTSATCAVLYKKRCVSQSQFGNWYFTTNWNISGSFQLYQWCCLIPFIESQLEKNILNLQSWNLKKDQDPVSDCFFYLTLWQLHKRRLSWIEPWTIFS